MDDDDRPAYCGDPNCEKDHPPRRVVELAARAIKRATKGQRGASHRCVLALVEGWGVDGVASASALWLGHLVENTALRHVDPSRLAGIQFAATCDGTVDATTPTTGADDVPPEVRWAGRYLIAWVMHDDDQIDALGASIDSDPEQLTACILALLDLCALGLRNPDALVRTGGGTG